MKSIIIKFLPVFIIALVTCLMFFKIFTKGLYPIPGDLLVSFYFPYYSGSWEGYDPWTTHKELLSADSIRQIYLWKEFAMEQFKKGEMPLWNPYTFSGQPLLANFQSSVFYPFNIFYLFADPRSAWLLLIIIQPLLGGLFMYLLVRFYKISKIASIFSAIAFMFSSYLITWMENGNVAHSYIWLPLAFLAINKFLEKIKFRYILLLIASLSLSIFGGHPQTAIYIYSVVGIYSLYKIFFEKISKQNIIKVNIIVFSAIAVSLAISAIQLIPTIDFYKVSPISLPFSKEIFDRGIVPIKNLVTFFASDFFGHPANNNFWSFSYGDFTPYFGVIPLVFSLWTIYKLWKLKFVKFAALSSAFFILAAIPGPITYLIKTFQIPVLDSTTPSRFISISIFLLVILSGFGLNDLLANFKEKKYLLSFLKFLMPIFLIYLLMWAFAIFAINFLEPKDTWIQNMKVTRRNLILPTVMFLSIPFGIIGTLILKKRIKETYIKNLFIGGIFSVTLIGAVYFSNKFLPIAPKKFIFPQHPLFTQLQQMGDIDRFYADGTAHVDFNFPTHYKIFTPEGYDSLRLERYAQLLASANTGTVPKTYFRSDAVLPNQENGYRKRLLDLLGAKYLLNKEDNPKDSEAWKNTNFSQEKTEGVWRHNKFEIYERKTALPRIFLTTNYYVAKNDQDTLDKIYDQGFNLETVILEKEPTLKIESLNEPIVIPQNIYYSPNSVKISTSAKNNVLLFFSDTYEKDWNVFVDGKKSEILRANYAFRAVEVPQGDHEITFRYQPKSFHQGAMVSGVSIIAVILTTIYLIKKRKF